MFLRQIFDPWLAQSAYLVGCPRTGEALIVDPQRDIDRYDLLAAENDLRITAATETHIHADFLSGVPAFAARADVHGYLSGEGGPDWLYRWPGTRPRTTFLRHGARFSVGGIRVTARHTPGHTPATSPAPAPFPSPSCGPAPPSSPATDPSSCTAPAANAPLSPPPTCATSASTPSTATASPPGLA